MLKRFYSSLIFLGVSFAAFAQPSNDECATAITLPEVELYCSDDGEFTNEGATFRPDPFGYEAPACWRNQEKSHDVWFRFRALKTFVRVTVDGNSSVNSPGGTLSGPEVALYSGNCGGILSELDCKSDAAFPYIAEAFRGRLTVGAYYYIRIDGRRDLTGTFQLCVEQTNPPVLAGSDCLTSAVLCDKSSTFVEQTTGAGNDPTEFKDAPCFQTADGEVASKWFRWTCSVSGTLTFALTPNNKVDDLDFVVFELPGGPQDCANKTLLRCMASGEQVARYPTRCHGPTGLRTGETDVSEDAGCADPSQNNWLAPLDMVAGRSYALGVSNYTPGSGSGFSLDFGGDGEFLGPTADFMIDPLSGLKCEQDFTIEDLSFFANGQVISWDWNFGKDAIPAGDTTQGPHTVNYNSFGEKSISLTIVTDEGCQVTVIKTIFVEPCCEDLPDLAAIRDSVHHLTCGGGEDGAIFISATGGTPEYEYSLDGMNFGPTGGFTNLAAGTYTLYARDIKGCLDTIQLVIDEPPLLSVNAGPDQHIKLGDCTTIVGRHTPSNRLVSYQWTGGADGDLECDTCARTKVTPAMGTTTYTITVRDSMGCEASDSVTIFVEIVRPYFAPNVISPNGDGLNDVFTIYGGNGLKAIITLEVYDRWGELVYKGENFPPGDEGIDMGLRLEWLF